MNGRIIEKRYIDTGAGQIHIRQTGDHTRPPLILLHQTASSSVMYERMMGQLHKKFWCIAPDMIGFGRSDRPELNMSDRMPSIADHAALFWEVIDKLDIKNPVLFGHHTGASVALQMATDRPQQVMAIGLSGPPLLTPQQIDIFRAGLMPIQIDKDGRFLQETWDRISKKDQNGELDLFLRETMLTIEAGDSYPAAYEAVFEQRFEEQLRTLRSPVLLMAGEADSLYASLSPTEALLPDGIRHEVHHIPDTGSYICDTHPTLVAKLLCDFFLKR